MFHEKLLYFQFCNEYNNMACITTLKGRPGATFHFQKTLLGTLVLGSRQGFPQCILNLILCFEKELIIIILLHSSVLWIYWRPLSR